MTPQNGKLPITVFAIVMGLLGTVLTLGYNKIEKLDTKIDNNNQAILQQLTTMNKTLSENNEAIQWLKEAGKQYKSINGMTDWNDVFGAIIKVIK